MKCIVKKMIKIIDTQIGLRSEEEVVIGNVMNVTILILQKGRRVIGVKNQNHEIMK